MEEQIIQKPCVVQKIETPQGFSVSYKEHLLYSKYNPSKNIISAVNNLQILPGTVILCFSPLLGYGLNELIQKLQENCLIILCEAEQALYDFSKAENQITKILNQNNISTILEYTPAKLHDLPLNLYELCKSGKYKRVIKIDFSAGVQFNSDFYQRLFAACTDSVMTFWKNRITLTRFGRRYSKNLLENLKYLSDSKPITDYFNSVQKPIIVFGAGESTQKTIEALKAGGADLPDNYFILCADTALQPLLKNGIKPDGVFVEEAQSVIVKAFTGTPKNIHIFAGLSSIPNLAHRTDSKNISYFFTEYANGAFFNNLKAQTFLPPANKPFGSVGLTAVYYALKFRANTNVPVYVTGLDFSYSAGITHTRGALAHILRMCNSNRLSTIANYNAAYAYGTEKIKDKSGKDFFTTITLKSYAQMFNSFFGGTENLFDTGESGIKLEIPHADCSCPCTKTDNKFIAEIKNQNASKQHSATEFLLNEHRALETLRNLLTGKSELKGEALLEEIKKIAAPREYLYLHFADGWQFSTDQSFLNRIRTEIDFFLKHL